MIELSIRSDLSRMEQSLLRIAGRQIPFAASAALNDVARGARDVVNAAMPRTFDRPNPFTQRAVVAPKDLAATKDKWAATVTLQPIQAKYLLHEEIGGTRSPAENTLKPANALLLPRAGLALDRFGGIPRATVAKLKAQLNKAAGKQTAKRHALKRKNHKRIKKVANRDRGVFYVGTGHPRLAGGFWQRLPGHRIQQLIGFAKETHYSPRFGFHEQVHAYAAEAWTSAFVARLHEAIGSAR